MNLLSIGAAYGVVVAVFQWGWLGGLFGLDRHLPRSPRRFPLLFFAVLFGLSMDYEVFLVSRIREAYHRDRRQRRVRRPRPGRHRPGHHLRRADHGRASSSASSPIPSPFVKMIGLGLATAIAIDATVVRMVLVPATMALMGRANWWLPGWLDRLLPHLSLESRRGRSRRTDVPARRPAAGRRRCARCPRLTLSPHRKDDPMIEAKNLTKTYGDKTAVDDISFTVQPGQVTGFLGPNGAGKSTTMRMIVGLDRPDRAAPSRSTASPTPSTRAAAPRSGALLEAKAVHTGRSAAQPPARRRRHPRHRPEARRRGHRDGRPAERRRQAGRRLLARHGPAPRHRRRAARRPADADPRRAGQRPRPRGRPVGPEPAARASPRRAAPSSCPRT